MTATAATPTPSTNVLQQYRTDWHQYRRLMNYVKPYRNRYVLALLASIPASAIAGGIPWAIGRYVDILIKGHAAQGAQTPSPLMWLLPLAIVGITLLQALFEYMSRYCSNFVGYAISRDLREQLFDRLLEKDLAHIKTRSFGDLVTRYYADPTRLQDAIVNNMQGFMVEFFKMLALAGGLFYLNVGFATLAVGVISLIIFPVHFISQKVRRLDNENREATAALNSVFHETVEAFRDVLTFRLEGFQSKRYLQSAQAFFSTSMRITKSGIVLKPLMEGISAVGISIIVMIGSFQVLAGHMTPGQLSTFLIALIMLYTPVKTVGAIFGKIQRILAPAGRIFDLMDLQAEIQEAATPITLGPVETIEFHDVWFGYKPDKPVLKGIQLTIQRGETLALVGPSGGGKSTIVDLMPRMMDPQQGAVLVNNTDIRLASLASLRKQVAIVAQETTLLNLSIRDNVRLGRLEASDEEVQQALERASLWDWVESLPQGWDTPVGKRGTLLSGGQRQRVAIARAFLKDAPVLILDEATSALDNASEAAIQGALQELMANRTVIIVAHRLSTVRQADRIVVIDDGQIAAQGTHAELLDNRENTLYRHFHELQLA